MDARDGEISLSAPDGPRVVGRVAVALEEAGVTVDGVTVRTPTLEDVFLEVTGNWMRAPEGEEEPR